MRSDEVNGKLVRDTAPIAGFAKSAVDVENLGDLDAERLAIQEGIDAIEAGRVRDFDNFDREFRERNGMRAAE